MQTWKFETRGNRLEIKPPIEITCPFCGTRMLPHDIGPIHSPHGKGKAVDIGYKCPHCSYYAAFGVAISPEQAEKLKPYERQLYPVEKLENPESEKVLKRLRQWGYW